MGWNCLILSSFSMSSSPPFSLAEILTPASPRRHVPADYRSLYLCCHDAQMMLHPILRPAPAAAPLLYFLCLCLSCLWPPWPCCPELLEEVARLLVLTWARRVKLCRIILRFLKHDNYIMRANHGQTKIPWKEINKENHRITKVWICTCVNFQ